MWLNIHHPANVKVLLALGNGDRQNVTLRPADASMPVNKSVQRLWGELAQVLPAETRCYLNGVPALVHPTSGLVLGLVIGEEYALRLPPALVREAVDLGLRRALAHAGRPINVQAKYGADWLLGNWQPRESNWLRRLYRFHDEATQQSRESAALVFAE